MIEKISLEPWFNYCCKKDDERNYMIFVLFFSESGAAICTFYLRGVCNKSAACPFRHVKGDQTVVCKHWLRGLCKKGDDCEFLHEYDMSKMPECYFFSKFGKYCTLYILGMLNLGSIICINVPYTV